MPSLKHLVRLLFRGPGRRGPWSEPPSLAARQAAQTVEATKDGLTVSITWEPAKYRTQGTHTYRVAVTRWYQDREGAWRNTTSLHRDDLRKVPPLLAECLAKVP